jgi:hypothetical protein
MTGKPKVTNWFQSVVSVTPRTTRLPSNPQPFSIPNCVAALTAAPPGSTCDSALPARSIRSAWKKLSPGSTVIQGGASLRTNSAAEPTSARIHHQESDVITPQTSP